MEAEERGEKLDLTARYPLGDQAQILVWSGVSLAVEKLDLQAVTIEIAEFLLVDKAAKGKAWMRKGRESHEETCINRSSC